MFNEINQIVEDLNLKDLTRNELWKELRNKTFEEMEEEIWYLYCFYKDIKNIAEKYKEREE